MSLLKFEISALYRYFRLWCMAAFIFAAAATRSYSLNA